MEYYVYAHRDLQGNLLYIGKGKDERDSNIIGRSPLWNEGIDSPFIVERICEGLDESTALFVEMCIIKALNPPLNSKLCKRVLLPEDFKQNVTNITKECSLEHSEEKVSIEKKKRLLRKLKRNQLTKEEQYEIDRGLIINSDKYLTEEQIKIKKVISKKLKIQRKCKEKLGV